MAAYCLDTDILSAVLRARPPLSLVRRLARVPAQDQFTTSITVGELVYGAAKSGREDLARRIRALIRAGGGVRPFDEAAAEVYGITRGQLERTGTTVAEPDLRIASIALAGNLVLVTGNERHFRRVPGLVVENWLA